MNYTIVLINRRLPEVIGAAGCSRAWRGGICGVLINTHRSARTTEDEAEESGHEVFNIDY